MSLPCCSPRLRLMRTLHMLHSNFFKAFLSCQILSNFAMGGPLIHPKQLPSKTTSVVRLLGEVDFNSNFVWNAFLCCSLQVSHRKPNYEANRKSQKRFKKATPVRRLKNQKVHTLLAHLRRWRQEIQWTCSLFLVCSNVHGHTQPGLLQHRPHLPGYLP